MIWFRVAGVCLALLAGGRSIQAQVGAALEHYHRGQSLLESSRLAEALNEFRSAFALDPRPHRGDRVGMHFEDYDPEFEMGRLEARLGHLTEAKRLFDACARHGYTEKSQNAEEFRRWRAVAEAAGSSAPPPSGLSLPETRPLPVLQPSPSPPSLIAVQASDPTSMTPVPRPTDPHDINRTPRPIPKTKEASTVGPLSARAIPTATPLIPTPTIAGPRFSFPPPSSLRDQPVPFLRESLLGAGLLGLAALAWRERRLRAAAVDENGVAFGRYVLRGLLGCGRSSFVYAGRDRKTGADVAVRIRRPDRAVEKTEAFPREITALDGLAPAGTSALAPVLLSRGVRRIREKAFEFAALELLSGRHLRDLSQDGPRRLDPALAITILRELARVLREARRLGVSHPELKARDVFVLDPVPTNAGSEIRIRIFGLEREAGDPSRDELAMSTIAAELFRSPCDSWEQDPWVVENVPPAVRAALETARKGGGPASFDVIERSLIESTNQMRQGPWK